uniref:Uncharacterized protein n=1 Tax=Faecalibaculum rodentium TaxID=1702221 RepID=A0A140DRU3_9FIRM|nr:hypothetical protein AALO17_02360 [Faecalibaculum rodentium]
MQGTDKNLYLYPVSGWVVIADLYILYIQSIRYTEQVLSQLMTCSMICRSRWETE